MESATSPSEKIIISSVRTKLLAAIPQMFRHSGQLWDSREEEPRIFEEVARDLGLTPERVEKVWEEAKCDLEV